MYHAMDQLAIAQYLSRLGLLLGDTEALSACKEAWMNGAAWQPLRCFVEDCLVVRDPFELFVAQNFALDGLLYPLVYERVVDDFLSTRGASAVAMLTHFMNDWFDETRKWIDAVLKTAAAESPENRAVIEGWTRNWSARRRGPAACRRPGSGRADRRGTGRGTGRLHGACSQARPRALRNGRGAISTCKLQINLITLYWNNEGDSHG